MATEQIAYYSYSLDPAVDVPGQDDIFLLDPASKAVRRLTDDSTSLDFVSDRDPRLSPDGRRLAIHRSSPADPVPVVTVLDVRDGSDIAQVVRGYSPVWYDDDRLLFLSTTAPNVIGTIQLSTKQVSELVRLPDDLPPSRLAWHRDGGLAIGSSPRASGQMVVGLITAQQVADAVDDGRTIGVDDVVVLGRLHESIGSPTWSPDGRTLAIGVSGEDGSEWVATLDLTTLAYRTLTTPPAGMSDLSPAFSPDGLSVAFCRSSGNEWSEIHVVDRGSRRTRQLTDDKKKRYKGGLSWR